LSGLVGNTGASPEQIFSTTAATIGYVILLLFVSIYLPGNRTITGKAYSF
jgi:hypothetical protein